MPLYFQWFKHRRRMGKVARIELNEGDIYIMSDKAVGWDKKATYILKHSTGSNLDKNIYSRIELNPGEKLPEVVTFRAPRVLKRGTLDCFFRAPKAARRE